MSLFAVLRKLREEKFLEEAKPAKVDRGARKISGASQFFSNREEISIYIIFKDR
jgi:hypothetical protein